MKRHQRGATRDPRRRGPAVPTASSPRPASPESTSRSPNPRFSENRYSPHASLDSVAHASAAVSSSSAPAPRRSASAGAGRGCPTREVHHVHLARGGSVAVLHLLGFGGRSRRERLPEASGSEVSTTIRSPVSASSSSMRPTGGSSASRRSLTRSAIKSCRRPATPSALLEPACQSKSDTTKHHRPPALMRRERYSSAMRPRRSRVRSGRWYRSSRSTRSTCRRPFRGGTNFSIRSLNR